MTPSEAALRHFVDKPSVGIDAAQVRWALDTIDRLCQALDTLGFGGTARLLREQDHD